MDKPYLKKLELPLTESISMWTGVATWQALRVIGFEAGSIYFNLNSKRREMQVRLFVPGKPKVQIATGRWLLSLDEFQRAYGIATEWLKDAPFEDLEDVWKNFQPDTRKLIQKITAAGIEIPDVAPIVMAGLGGTEFGVEVRRSKH